MYIQILVLFSVLLISSACSVSVKNSIPQKEEQPEVLYEKGITRYLDDDVRGAYQFWIPLAKEGFPAAQRRIGLGYYYGILLEQDYNKATDWIKKSAEQNDVEAQYYLGINYYHGKNYDAGGVGIMQDDSKAFDWLSKAADQGHAKAQEVLGLMYILRPGIEGSREKSVKWLTLAANQKLATAQYNLGHIYALRFSEQDNIKAKYWYKKAFEQGIRESQANINYIESEGSGYIMSTTGNSSSNFPYHFIQPRYPLGQERTQKWFLNAKRGHRRSQCNVADLYLQGLGGYQIDKDKGFYWLNKCTK